MVIVVKGRYLRHAARGGEVFFIYEYACIQCGDTFLETCDEVHEPCICQECFSGMQRERGYRNYQKKKQSSKGEEVN